MEANENNKKKPPSTTCIIEQQLSSAGGKTENFPIGMALIIAPLLHASLALAIPTYICLRAASRKP